MAADARPGALTLWAPILVICHQRHTLLLPRAVLAHHQDGHDDDYYGCDDGKDSGDDVHASNCTFFDLMRITQVTVAVIHSMHHTYGG